MRKFKRVKTIDELQETCAELGWKLDTRAYDAGSDGVYVEFETLSVKGTFYLNTFSGRIVVKPEGRAIIHSDDDLHDHEEWFKNVLEAVYVP